MLLLLAADVKMVGCALAPQHHDKVTYIQVGSNVLARKEKGL
jgi:hypothetical protein